jgi:hypothetical protein
VCNTNDILFNDEFAQIRKWYAHISRAWVSLLGKRECYPAVFDGHAAVREDCHPPQFILFAANPHDAAYPIVQRECAFAIAGWWVEPLDRYFLWIAGDLKSCWCALIGIFLIGVFLIGGAFLIGSCCFAHRDCFNRIQPFE